VQGFKANSDSVPRRRSHAISAKAQPLRSQVAQSITPNPQAAQHAQALAQQQMERLQAWRAQQVHNNLQPSTAKRSHVLGLIMQTSLARVWLDRGLTVKLLFILHYCPGAAQTGCRILPAQLSSNIS
jgi:hypothetical protein